MREWYIYVLIDPRDATIRYCGWTTNPDRRLRHHLNRSGLEHNHKASWVVSLLRLGFVPILKVVDSGLDPKGHIEAEKHWIRELRELGNPLTNLTDGGEGCLGLKHSPESIERTAASNRGRVHSPETRAKVAEAGRGRKHSTATKAKMRASFTHERLSQISKQISGLKRSDETKAKMSAAATRWQTGRKLSDETKAKISEAGKRRYRADPRV